MLELQLPFRDLEMYMKEQDNTYLASLMYYISMLRRSTPPLLPCLSLVLLQQIVK
jgi:hypothetical protein